MSAHSPDSPSASTQLPRPPHLSRLLRGHLFEAVAVGVVLSAGAAQVLIGTPAQRAVDARVAAADALAACADGTGGAAPGPLTAAQEDAVLDLLAGVTAVRKVQAAHGDGPGASAATAVGAASAKLAQRLCGVLPAQDSGRVETGVRERLERLALDAPTARDRHAGAWQQARAPRFDDVLDAVGWTGQQCSDSGPAFAGIVRQASTLVRNDARDVSSDLNPGQSVRVDVVPTWLAEMADDGVRIGYAGDAAARRLAPSVHLPAQQASQRCRPGR